MRVSVVVCTYNRRESLLATLESLRYQSYPDFEVIVVNGPSTDGTEQALAPWRSLVKFATNPLANLSVSRNIGIKASAGDVIAFIDDDALPEFDWLAQALPHFGDPTVAGVGGIVFDHTGMALQYRYSAANRFAETAARDDRPFDEQCFPGTFQFPYLQGTNALFSRHALERVGGFDETFDYYLDETDLCCRLVDAGYQLRQLPDAAVHHKFLPSGIRDHQRIVTNWFPIMKNHVYFSYRHALGPFSEYDILEHARAFLQNRVDDARFHEDAGRLPEGTADRCAMVCAEAMVTGAQLGRDRATHRLPQLEFQQDPFLPFDTLETARRRKITMISSGYTPNVTGGIARFFSDVAPALAQLGHEIRVVTRATGNPAVDLEDGVWVHRIEAPGLEGRGVVSEVAGPVDDFATAALREIERIGGWSSHDVVYGPLWDVEMIGVAQHTPLPVGVHVATPHAVAARMAGHLDDPGSRHQVERLVGLERSALDCCDVFHANGRTVMATIEREHPGSIDPARWEIVPLGMQDQASSQAEEPQSEPGDIRVLFVGRFEARKGIDTVLEMIERVAPTAPAVRFVLAGEDRPLTPGDPLLGATWQRRHAALEWAERVVMTGPVDDPTLHALYESADIVVLPSRYESFGLVVVEAMMHGAAVVSCSGSGIEDVLVDGVSGLLVPPGDAPALADAVSRLISDPGLREELGAEARRAFVEHFHIDRCAERFSRMLERVRLLTPATVNTRSGVGRGAMTMRAGDESVVESSGGRRRMVVRAHVDSIVALGEGSTRRAERLTAAWHRLPVDDQPSVVRITLVSGSIDLHGIIEIEDRR